MIYELHVGDSRSFDFGMGRFNECLLIYWRDTYTHELMALRRKLGEEMRAWLVEQMEPHADWAFDDKFVSTSKVYFMTRKEMMLFKLRFG